MECFRKMVGKKGVWEEGLEGEEEPTVQLDRGMVVIWRKAHRKPGRCSC